MRSWQLFHPSKIKFSWTRLFFYRLFALLVGIPAALIFGLLYAIFIVLNTFACIPLGKLLTIPGNWIAKVRQNHRTH